LCEKLLKKLAAKQFPPGLKQVTPGARRLPYTAAAAILCLFWFHLRITRGNPLRSFLAHPEQHLFHVSIEIPDVKMNEAANGRLERALRNSRFQQPRAGKFRPSWTATCAHREVDKLTWHVKGSGTVTVRYDTFWDDPGPFNSQLNGEHGLHQSGDDSAVCTERRAEKSVITLSDVRVNGVWLLKRSVAGSCRAKLSCWKRPLRRTGGCPD